MTRASPTSLTSYARAIERAWSAFVERPVLLSQRDWEQIRDWHGRAIPLDVIRGAIDALAEKARRRRRPRGLHDLASTVEEEWQGLREGQVGGLAAGAVQEAVPDEDDSSAATDAAVAAWQRRAADASAGRTLAALVARLLDAHAAGTDPRELDRALDEALPGVVAPEVLVEIEAAVERELAPWRDRLPAADLAAARRRGVRRRLRRQVGLPRLAGPEGGP